jgi:exosome complex exonuclease RRP6
MIQSLENKQDRYFHQSSINGSIFDVIQANPKSKKPLPGNAFRTKNLLKPQLAFDVKPNNADASPWKPLLTTKPHAKIPLENSLGTITSDSEQQQYDYTNFLPLLALPPLPATPEGLSKSQRLRHNKRLKKLREMGSMRSALKFDNTDNYFRYRHPYETEILELKYPDTVYQKADPIMYQPVETTSATFVDTEEGVLEMLKELKLAKEIAVDLEHHDARSYVGLVSLMQISTREKDWIVDTLKPWRQNLQILNEVFADPNIVKVYKLTMLHFSIYSSNVLGVSWCLYGHRLASTRFGSLRRGFVRYSLGKPNLGICRRKFGLLAQEIHRF